MMIYVWIIWKTYSVTLIVNAIHCTMMEVLNASLLFTKLDKVENVLGWVSITHFEKNMVTQKECEMKPLKTLLSKIKSWLFNMFFFVNSSCKYYLKVFLLHHHLFLFTACGGVWGCVLPTPVTSSLPGCRSQTWHYCGKGTSWLVVGHIPLSHIWRVSKELDSRRREYWFATSKTF